MKRRLWSEDEIAKLRRLWKRDGWKCADQFPGRTVEAVRNKAYAIGLCEGVGRKPAPKPVADPQLRAALAYRAQQRGIMAAAIRKLQSGKPIKSSDNTTMLIARQVVEAQQRAACPVEQAKTILRRRHTPVVSMAYTAKGGPKDRYQVGNRFDVSEQDLLALAEQVAA